MNVLELTKKLGLNKKQKHKCNYYIILSIGKYGCCVYVSSLSYKNIRYLHSNGTLLTTAFPFDTGYYKSKEEARSTAQKYLETVC